MDKGELYVITYIYIYIYIYEKKILKEINKKSWFIKRHKIVAGQFYHDVHNS